MSIGTDMNSSWEFNEHGDLKTISNKENITQAIINRLKTNDGELTLFYANYGSYLRQFYGWKKNQSALDFMKIEIENRLKLEPRLTSYNAELSYIDEGIRIDMDMKVSNDENYTTSLVLTDNGVDVIGN